VKICNQLVKCEKIWFFRQDPGCSDLIFARGQIYPGKRPKQSQRAKQKFWGQQVLFGTKFLKFGPERVNLATLTPMYSTVNCTSATSYNYDATITFFVIAQQWTSDLSTINISWSAIWTQSPVQLTGLLYLESECGTVI